jgi:hypothetical protein
MRRVPSRVALSERVSQVDFVTLKRSSDARSHLSPGEQRLLSHRGTGNARDTPDCLGFHHERRLIWRGRLPSSLHDKLQNLKSQSALNPSA